MERRPPLDHPYCDQWRDDYQDLEEEFVNAGVVGKGTYGCVYKVTRRRDPKKFYAIKKIEQGSEKDGFPLTAVREIALLKKLSHKNVITLKNVFCSKPSKWNAFKRSTFLVMEYMEHDLQTIMRHEKFKEDKVKAIMREILSGVAYLHAEKIIHRDLKCGNILMNNRGEVKIADFGLARVKTNERLTQNVVTFWYRAPELLLGKVQYDEKIDVWSLGCVFAELMTNEVLFMGQDASNQFACICSRLGNPVDSWPEVVTIGWWNELKPKAFCEPNLEAALRRRCEWVSPALLDLLRKMLEFNPARRLSAEEALRHAYFRNEPPPCELRYLANFKREYHQPLIKPAEAKRKKEEVLDRNLLANKEFEGEPKKAPSGGGRPGPGYGRAPIGANGQGMAVASNGRAEQPPIDQH